MPVSSLILLLTNEVLLLIALLVFTPIVILLIECLAALLPVRQLKENGSISTKFTVLVPAHNEASSIRPVLEGLLDQIKDKTRLVVIADNCTDDTAATARSTGATVIERQDVIHRGKGYALDYGLRFLSVDPPDVVIVVDADCEVQPGTLDRIATQAVATGRPVQAIYLMEQPINPKPKDAVSALAFMVKNLVRPQGLLQLGLPCPLTGTGMAFPWSVIRNVSLASGNIVEDMQLGVDLALNGYPPLFCSNTRVIGLLPQQEQASKSQRTRWEHGHLQTLLTQVPRLLKSAMKQKRFDLLVMALDLAIPPISLLVMLWLAALAVSIAAGFLGASWLPAALLGWAGILLFVAIGTAWAKFGRKALPAHTLLAIPFYILWKIPLYFKFLIRPQKQWVRTERDRT